jgi:hypothetical protein
MQYGDLVGFLSGCAQMSSIASNHSDEILRMVVDTLTLIIIMLPLNITKRRPMRWKQNYGHRKSYCKNMKDIVYYYGRWGQDVQSHTEANIRQYEKYIKENIKKTAMYRKMAFDAARQEVSLSNKWMENKLSIKWISIRKEYSSSRIPVF